MEYNYTEAEVLDELGMLNNQEYEDNEVYSDIPEMELRTGGKFTNWYSAKKETKTRKKTK